MTRQQRVDLIETPSQLWVRSHFACYDGRRRLGRRSIGQFWHAPDAYATDLVWIANHLRPQDDALVDAYWYSIRNFKYPTGRWKRKYTREQLTRLFVQYGVTIPARLL